jgi:hypothetical protein
MSRNQLFAAWQKLHWWLDGELWTVSKQPTQREQSAAIGDSLSIHALAVARASRPVPE